MKFNPGEQITKIGNQVDCVLFIMSGIVLNSTTRRYFESGHILNFEYILLNQDILQDHWAESEVQCLKYDKKTFDNILLQFPEF